MQAKVERVIFNILAGDLEATARFYERLANFERVHSSDWYIILAAPGETHIELGIIDQVSQFVPRGARGVVEGCYLTLVVDDVYRAVEIAREMAVEIVEEPEDYEGGQVRAVIRDPNGVILDIATPASQLSVPPHLAVA